MTDVTITPRAAGQARPPTTRRLPCDLAETADVVVAGGGSAGAVLAARLNKDPARTVLLLEGRPRVCLRRVPAHPAGREQDRGPGSRLGPYLSRHGPDTADPHPAWQGTERQFRSERHHRAAGPRRRLRQMGRAWRRGLAFPRRAPALQAAGNTPTGNDAYHGRTGPLPIGSERCLAAMAATCQTLRPCCWRTLIAAGSRREDQSHARREGVALQQPARGLFRAGPRTPAGSHDRTYVENVTFIDPEGEVVGRQALSDRAQKLLDDAPADFSLEEDGPRYVGPGTAALAWRLGPPGRPVARGIDIRTIRDGRVSVLRTLIAAETDA